MAAARYAMRVLRLARVFGILLHHPDGLTLDDLAQELGFGADELRSDLVVFMNRDLPADLDWALLRGVGIEFIGPGGEEAESRDAEQVRLTSDAPLAELGLEYFSADVLGPLYRAATDLLAVEPDNQTLRSALARLTETLLAGVDDARPFGGEQAAQLRGAVRDRRRVRIVYWRAWRPGVGERVIEPYRVVSTRRGFEVDAGPLDSTGAIRTFLVSGIADLEVLDQTFQRPDDVAQRIEESRRTTPVRVVVPREASWVVERFAERVTIARGDDEALEVVADVLPPVRERVGLMATLAGPAAFVVEPAELTAAAAETAQALLAHHGLGQPASRAADRSEQMSSTSSSPTESRTTPSEIPSA
jgi:predicted DNA-binding transcriptional regulator YafY